MAGPLGDPPHGAAIVFGERGGRPRRSPQADPYVTNGLVTSWRVEPWTLV